MGSGDPSGLQNRRELASLALVSSTLTRFRHSAANSCNSLHVAHRTSARRPPKFLRDPFCVSPLSANPTLSLASFAAVAPFAVKAFWIFVLCALCVLAVKAF